MSGPSRFVVDARGVKHASAPGTVQRDQFWLTAQLLHCVERLRRVFPRSHFDIFIHDSLWPGVRQEDDNIAALRKIESRCFNRVQRIAKGADMGRAMLIHALSIEDGVVVSNDRFDEHVSSGLVSMAWVQERVWGYLFGRGDLVIPQLSPRHSSKEAHRAWRGRHLRSDSAKMSTALRAGPGAQAEPLKNNGKVMKVGPSEQVSILEMQSELLEGEPTTWVQVACSAGSGWLKRTHLKDVDGFTPIPAIPGRPESVVLSAGNSVRHERKEGVDMLTALRSGPGLRAAQARGVRVEGKEVASVLEVQEDVEDDGTTNTWVKISCTLGQGWIKREHLRYEPVAKRRRHGDKPEKWRCVVDKLGDGSSAEPLIKELQEVLAVHCLSLVKHQVEESKTSAEGAEGAGADIQMLCFSLPDATLEGASIILDAVRHGKVSIKVAGNILKFKDFGTTTATDTSGEKEALPSTGVETTTAQQS